MGEVYHLFFDEHAQNRSSLDPSVQRIVQREDWTRVCGKQSESKRVRASGKSETTRQHCKGLLGNDSAVAAKRESAHTHCAFEIVACCRQHTCNYHETGRNNDTDLPPNFLFNNGRWLIGDLILRIISQRERARESERERTRRTVCMTEPEKERQGGQ